MFKFSLVMALQGIMMDLQQSVGAGFFQPSGICSEFNNVVYICDIQTSCIKIFTTLKKTAEFLKGIGELFSEFSIYEKHQNMNTGTFQERSL